LTQLDSATLSAIKDSACVLFAYHDTGYVCIEALLELGAPIVALFTHEDDPREEIWWRSCTDLARRNSISVFTPEKITHDTIAQVAALAPKVIYSIYYRYLLPDALLALAPMGAYNLHGSLLPRYRGRAPVNWMLVNGEREGGVTLHHMVARADAGDIVAQRAVPIDDNDTALTLYRKLVPLGAEIFREYHPLIVTGRAPRIRQDLSKGNYFGRRRPEDGRIDWRWPARRVFNLVRALTHPYPGAFCFASGRKMLVWEAKIGAETGRRGDPGEIISERDQSVEVAAGEGSVILIRVQIEGDAEASARSVIGTNAATRMRAIL